MEYYIILVISFIGVVFGHVLARLAWSEVTPYYDWISALQVGVFAACLAVLLREEASIIWLVILTSLYLGFQFIEKYEFSYSMLPFLLWLSIDKALIGSLLFLYALPYASIRCRKMPRRVGTSEHGLYIVLKESFPYLALGVLIGIFL